MPAARSSTPFTLKLLPHLVADVPARARGYGLPVSVLLSALVWNDALAPNRALAALPRGGKHVRAPLSCSLRPQHRKLARRRAREQSLSLNAYLEALLEAHLARRGPLTILLSPK